jgi:hypothetical protein
MNLKVTKAHPKQELGAEFGHNDVVQQPVIRFLLPERQQLVDDQVQVFRPEQFS